MKRKFIKELLPDISKEALDAIRTDNGYLFEDAQTPPPYASGAGSATLQTDSLASMRSAMGLAPKTN